MHNIIEFPSGGEGSDEAPLFVSFSATPEQMLQVTMGMMLRIQASIDAAASLTADVLMELGQRKEKDMIQRQVIEDYQQRRRIILQGLYRELQDRFPPDEQSK